MSDRNVSVSPGETEYEERFERTTYKDGTISDSEPFAFHQPWQVTVDEMFKRVSEAGSGVASRETFRRTVRIVATEWEPVRGSDDEPPEEEEERPRNLVGFVAGEDIPPGSTAGTPAGSGELVYRRLPGQDMTCVGFVPSALKYGDLLMLEAQPYEKSVVQELKRHWIKRPELP